MAYAQIKLKNGACFSLCPETLNEVGAQLDGQVSNMNLAEMMFLFLAFKQAGERPAIKGVLQKFKRG